MKTIQEKLQELWSMTSHDDDEQRKLLNEIITMENCRPMSIMPLGMKTEIEIIQAKYDEALRGQLMVRDALSSQSDSPEHSAQIATEMREQVETLKGWNGRLCADREVDRKCIHDLTDASKSDGRLICLKCGELETAYARITELEKKSAPMLCTNHEQHNELAIKDASIKAYRAEIDVWKIDLEAAYETVAELEKTTNMQANTLTAYNTLQRRVYDLRCAIDGFIAATEHIQVVRGMFEFIEGELRT